VSAIPAGRVGSRQPWWLALFALAAAAALAAVLATHGHSRAAPLPPVRVVGPTPATQQIHFTLTLRLPGRPALKRFMRAVQDPRSPSFQHYITPQAFGARYGIAASAVAALERRLTAVGMTVTRAYPQRTALELRASAGQVERTFHVRLADYVDRHGRRFHAPLARATVPREMRAAVSGVAGLDTRPLEPQAVPTGGLKPKDAALAYDLSPLYDQGIRGKGQTVAIVSYSDYDDSDLAGYMQQAGLGGPTPQRVPVQGGANNADNTDEATLDVELVKGIAPDAQILVYEPPEDLPLKIGPVIDQIVSDHRADIVSISYGLCELQYSPDDIQNDEQAIEAGDATGVSAFVATGDQGAYECQRIDPADHRLSVPWPAASPGVVSVGGTRLILGADGSYQKEQGWEDALSMGGGGGGLSAVEPRPTWQSALGVQNQYSDGRRQIPDVSADSDLDTGWAIYYQGQSIAVGGTSAAAPFWAASMALIRQYAASQGVSKLGYVNPALYHIASTTQPYQPFHDVTEGGNRYYQATTGWDYVGGLGTPDVWNLARDLANYLKSQPGH
jgi:subtilase family serine protease